MKRYSAHYYGASNKQIKEVKIVLEQNGVGILFVSLEEEFWPIEDINPHPKNDDFKVYLSYKTDLKTGHLEIFNQDFLQAYKLNFVDFHQKQSNNYTFLKTGFFWAAILIGIILTGYWMYSSGIPKVVDKAVSLIPYSWEQKLGEPIFNNIKSTENIDSLKSEIIDSFFNELQWDSEFPSNVYVSNSNVVNAFALPGGKIIVYTGLLNKMNSYTELVGLLGHEYGHIEQRHLLKGIVQSMSTFAVISFILGDLTGIAGVFIEQANQIYNLKYSRAYETESDLFGLEKMNERSLDPHGIITLFNRLKESTDSISNSAIPDFLMTHPGIENRIRFIESKIQKQPKAYVEDKALESYFLRLKS
ncbi:MAG: M48 family metallopeptidase [Saprospiraceae bacterium]